MSFVHWCGDISMAEAKSFWSSCLLGCFRNMSLCDFWLRWCWFSDLWRPSNTGSWEAWSNCESLSCNGIANCYLAWRDSQLWISSAHPWLTGHPILDCRTICPGPKTGLQNKVGEGNMTKHDETSTSWNVSFFSDVSHQFNFRWRSLHQLALHKVLNRKTSEACINFGQNRMPSNAVERFRGGISCDCHLRGCLWVLNCGLRSSWCPNKPTHKSAMQISWNRHNFLENTRKQSAVTPLFRCSLEAPINQSNQCLPTKNIQKHPELNCLTA